MEWVWETVVEMTLIRLINLIESLRKNPNFTRKWGEIATLFNGNYADSVYESILNLIKRDLNVQKRLDDTIKAILVMMDKFPMEFQIKIISIFKDFEIDNDLVGDVLQKLNVNIIMQDFGILEFLFKKFTGNLLTTLTIYFEKSRILMENSGHVWFPQGILKYNTLKFEFLNF